MKTKTLILVLCLICQFCLGQTLTRKPLRGIVINDSIKMQTGYVLNLNSNTVAFINSQGFFYIMAKTNDTLLISSLGLKSKKIVLAEKDFMVSSLVVKLNIYINPLKEVIVTKNVIKPNLDKIQNIIDTEYFDDKQSSLKNPLMSTLEIVNGIDFVRIGKMIWKLFNNQSPENMNAIDYGGFSEIIPKRVTPFFFSNTLQLKKDEIGLFLIYCENDSEAKKLLDAKFEFELIEFLINKNEEFKRFTTFEK